MHVIVHKYDSLKILPLTHDILINFLVYISHDITGEYVLLSFYLLTI